LFEVMRKAEARKSGALGRSLNPFKWMPKGDPQPGAAADHSILTSAGAWMTRPVMLRLPLMSWVVFGLIFIGLIAVAVSIGYQTGQKITVETEQSYDKAVGALAAVKDQPAKPLLPASVTGVDASVALPPPKAETANGTVGDPRQGGLNYYRMTVLPAASKPELLRAVEFLKKNGFDATLIPVNNGRSLKLVALAGFAKPLSDPAAKKYESDLKALGRKWKTQEKGATDWKDMIPEKYKPGVN
jgi:hypothetical protein